MAQFPRNEVSLTTAADGGCASQLIINSAVGAAAGTIATVVALTLKNPSAGRSVGAAMRSVAYDVIPVTVGIGATFTLASCIAKDARNKSDWVNEAVGGAVAGAFAMGVKRKSLQAAFTGAVIFGTVAAAAKWFDFMEPGVDSIVKRPATGIVTPVNIGQIAGSAADFQRRLQ